MHFFEQIMANIQANSDILGFIGTILTIVASLYILKKESSNVFVRERYDKLIFPLFNLLESNLYQEVQTPLMQDAIKIIEENKSIVDGKLLEIAYFCTQSPTQENFNRLCSYADRTYDIYCLRLGLTLRSLNYRFFRNQYKHKASCILYAILYALLSTGVAVLFACLFLLGLAGLYSLFLGTNPMFQLVIAVLAMIACLVFVRYMDKQA